MALMPPENSYTISLEELKSIQEEAAKHGWDLRFYINNEKGEVTKTLVPSAVAPEGVHIAPQQRIGDSVKDKYFEHLHKMFGSGHLDQAEHDARVDAVMLANTTEEMEFLVKDLPKMTAQTPPPPVQRRRRPTELQLGIACLIGAGVLGSFHEEHLNALGGALLIILLVLIVSMLIKKMKKL